MPTLGDYFLDSIASLKDAEIRYREANERAARLEERWAVTNELAGKSHDCISRSKALMDRVRVQVPR